MLSARYCLGSGAIAVRKISGQEVAAPVTSLFPGLGEMSSARQVVMDGAHRVFLLGLKG